jgi:ribonuclease HII
MSIPQWHEAVAELSPDACVVGVDEVGRGPLAGDVVAAAVILDRQRPVAGLRDSKKLTAARREVLAASLLTEARAVSLGRASPDEIDTLNILQASLLAMSRAVDGLGVAPDLVLVDGRHLPVWDHAAIAVVGGDDQVAEIAAASIVAKVTRDQEMRELHEQWPVYGFAAHKGYPTRAHLDALREHGPCPQHRRSFAPVRAVIGVGSPKAQ